MGAFRRVDTRDPDMDRLVFQFCRTVSKRAGCRVRDGRFLPLAVEGIERIFKGYWKKGPGVWKSLKLSVMREQGGVHLG
jgi:hypothetical protein